MPLLLTPATHAMDYVKCEAMQKAKERAGESHSLIYRTLRSQYFSSIKEEICGPEPDILSFYKSSDPLEYSQARLAWAQCGNLNSDKIYSQLHALMDTDPDYIKAKARIAKIKADYEVEGCY